MKDYRHFIPDPGLLPALVANGRRPPDRREISKRWLAGTFLTGLTSCTLMGIALFAALNGQEQLATPPPLLDQTDLDAFAYKHPSGERGERLTPTLPRQSFAERQTFELSIVQKQGNKEIIHTQPFELLRIALAADRNNSFKYPKFNALNIFAQSLKASEPLALETAQIYSAHIESKVTLSIRDLLPQNTTYTDNDSLSADAMERYVRIDGADLIDHITKIDTLKFINPMNFDKAFKSSDIPEVKITEENVNVAKRVAAISNTYAEDIIPLQRPGTISDALNNGRYDPAQSAVLAQALTEAYQSNSLPAGIVLRIGVKTNQNNPDKTGDRLVRASIYNGMHHVLSVALNDYGRFIKSSEPEMTDTLKKTFSGSLPFSHIDSNNLPTVYDAIYQSILSYKLPESTATQLIKILATDVDLKSHASPNDLLEIFYAVPQKDSNTPPELRYIKAVFNGTPHIYYSFQNTDGDVDYYNAQGRSSKQFLLRKPVPNGIFRSPFGPRHHPILGYVRMHTGVDWAAPRGSPIVAAGDGVIIKVGYMRGYGNHTEIQHANGYITSYSHQNGFAANIKPGVHVHQGQVIGYVGSTGLSSGPHCHFEIIVNGTKVDPMRIRLPDNKALKGQDLEEFLQARNQINNLLNEHTNQKFAFAHSSTIE